MDIQTGGQPENILPLATNVTGAEAQNITTKLWIKFIVNLSLLWHYFILLIFTRMYCSSFFSFFLQILSMTSKFFSIKTKASYYQLSTNLDQSNSQSWFLITRYSVCVIIHVITYLMSYFFMEYLTHITIWFPWYKLHWSNRWCKGKSWAWEHCYLWLSFILTRHEVMRWWITVGRKAEIWCLFDFGVQKYTLYSYYISNFILPQPLPSTQPPQPAAFTCHQLLSLLQ